MGPKAMPKVRILPMLRTEHSIKNSNDDSYNTSIYHGTTLSLKWNILFHLTTTV